MNDLQKEFEKSGYTAWINSDIYPDGKIYTKEYTEWLERKLSERKQTTETVIDDGSKALLIADVSGSLLSEIEKDLGIRTRKFELWHDGAEWILSLNGDMKQCKTLRELICRNDR